MNLGTAWRCFWRALRDPAFAERCNQLLLPAPPMSAAPVAAKPEVAKPEADHARALQVLSLLQRDGRLLDFLTEDLTGADDVDIGAAVRPIHQECQAVLKKYLDLAPVLTEAEGDMVTVPLGFDPARIRLTGRVAGDPPFRGRLCHRGWQAAAVRLPEPSRATGDHVLAPAEVELS